MVGLYTIVKYIGMQSSILDAKLLNYKLTYSPLATCFEPYTYGTCFVCSNYIAVTYFYRGIYY